MCPLSQARCPPRPRSPGARAPSVRLPFIDGQHLPTTPHACDGLCAAVADARDGLARAAAGHGYGACLAARGGHGALAADERLHAQPRGRPTSAPFQGRGQHHPSPTSRTSSASRHVPVEIIGEMELNRVVDKYFVSRLAWYDERIAHELHSLRSTRLRSRRPLLCLVSTSRTTRSSRAIVSRTTIIGSRLSASAGRRCLTSSTES
jgi:hypothetical protein